MENTCISKMGRKSYTYLKIEDKGALRKIVLNNPSKNNSLNTQAYQELTDALQQAGIDPTVSVVAITGEGSFYSSGNDLSSFMTAADPFEKLRESKEILRNLIHAFYTFPKLLICVVNGPCIGIAATTAALSDVIYASDTAYFHTPFTSLGLCAEGCASYTFPRILGRSKANEMLMLNHKLTADEAHRFGLVSEIVNKSDFETKLWPRIENFARLSAGSIQVTKKLLQRFEISKLDEACDAELDELYKRFGTEDFMNAIVAFMSRKRQAKL